MAVLTVRTYPDDVLKQKAKDVSHVGESEKKLAQDMIETMFASKGVGLAAPQVGILRNIIVCSPRALRDDVHIFYNPVIVEEKGEVTDTEGCLSLPCASGEITRAKKIRVKALDQDGNPIDFTVSDFFARVIQHEMDHLKGILFIDHLGFQARKEAIDCAIRVKKL